MRGLYTLDGQYPFEGFPDAVTAKPQKEYHYAPLTGMISKRVNGEFLKIDGWSEHHKLMDEFLQKKQRGEIVLIRTENYGHVLFNGHSGRVDVYGVAP